MTPILIAIIAVLAIVILYDQILITSANHLHTDTYESLVAAAFEIEQLLEEMDLREEESNREICRLTEHGCALNAVLAEERQARHSIETMLGDAEAKIASMKRS